MVFLTDQPSYSSGRSDLRSATSDFSLLTPEYFLNSPGMDLMTAALRPLNSST